jgi:hypothetical protein
MDAASQGATLFIGHYPVFMPIDVFAAIQVPVLKKSAEPAAPCSYHIEADDRRGRGSRATSRYPAGLNNAIRERLLQADELPASEILVHHLPQAKAGRQAAPLATNSSDVAHDIMHLIVVSSVQRQQRGEN